MADPKLHLTGMSIKQLDIRFVGLFLLFGFSSAFGSEAAITWPMSAWIFDTASNLVRLLFFIGAALFARRIPTLLGRPRVIRISAGCMAAFSALFFALAALPPSLPISYMSLGAAIIVNAAFSLLYLAWMEAYARMNAYHALVYFAGSHLLSSLFSSFVLELGSLPTMAVILSAAPLLSTALLQKGVSAYMKADPPLGEAQSATWRISFRPLFLLTLFGFTGTFLRSSLVANESILVRICVCGLSLIVLLSVVVLFERIELKWLYQFSVPLVIGGIACAIVSPQWGQTVGAAASGMGTVLFLTFVTGIFCNISYRFGVNAIWLFGFTQASITLGSLLAHSTNLLYSISGWEPSHINAFLAALATILVAVSMLLVSDRDFKNTWGFEPDHDPNAVHRTTGLSLEERCDLMARRFGLTSREEEILVHIAKGQTLASIAQELYIADSTMKTHSRHIYRKIGIENKRALCEYIENYHL